MNQPDYYLKFDNAAKGSLLIKKRIDRREPVFSYLLRIFPEKSSLLDIGCGVGRFLTDNADYFNCTGIDVSKMAVMEARFRLSKRVKIIQGDISSTKELRGERFRIVTIFDVLEHQANPENILLAIKKYLSPESRIFITIPNNSSLSRKMRNKKWWALADSGHISLLEVRQWQDLIRKCGYRIKTTFSTGLINYPNKPYRIDGMPRVFQALTQIMALFGIRLPYLFNDLLCWELVPDFFSE